MVSVEAHIASKMQVEALFGDLQVLRGLSAGFFGPFKRVFHIDNLVWIKIKPPGSF